MSKTLLVLVPKPGTSAARLIDRGSAVVTDPARHVIDTPVLVYYEGNRYGFEDLSTFHSKVVAAAGRLDARYPTVARACFPLDEFAAVGLFTCADQSLTVTDTDALCAWCDGRMCGGSIY